MSTKPSYLGLLNAIAVGEGRGHALFAAWSRATPNQDLREVLDVVAIRECEHAAAFTKRVCELGFSVRESASEDFEEKLALAESDAGDRKKFKKILGYGKKSEQRDELSGLFSDTTIDPVTGALLGRFIAEERDSGRRLKAAFNALKSEGGEEADDDPVLADIAERIDRLSSTLEELKTLRCR